MSQMIRLFAALALPPDISAVLQSRQTGLEGAKWRPLAAFHVTLRFYGEMPEDVARDLDAALLEVEKLPFEIRLQGAGAFSEGEGVHAVWAGVADNPALNRLAKACEIAARHVGLKADPRRYRPHVTLAYLRRAAPASVAAWVETHSRLQSPPIAISSFGLYSSRQTREGSRYHLEAEYPLA